MATSAIITTNQRELFGVAEVARQVEHGRAYKEKPSASGRGVSFSVMGTKDPDLALKYPGLEGQALRDAMERDQHAMFIEVLDFLQAHRNDPNKLLAKRLSLTRDKKTGLVSISLRAKQAENRDVASLSELAAAQGITVDELIASLKA